MAIVATTVGSMIKSAMRKAGILGRGETLNPQDGADILTDFRQMVDAWSNETLLIPAVTTISKVLDGATKEYTIGVYPTSPIPDSHIETARPEKILAAFIRDSGGTDYPLKIIDVGKFSNLSRKSNAYRPTMFYLRKGWPLNTIIFESYPNDLETLHFEMVQPLSEILPALGLNETINLPPGYERSLIYNFALELTPEFGKDPKSFVVVTAVESKKWLKRNNYRSVELKIDSALSAQRGGDGTYIIESGPC